MANEAFGRLTAINPMVHSEPCIYLFLQAFCHPLQIHFLLSTLSNCEAHLSWRSLALAQLLLIYSVSAKATKKRPSQRVCVMCKYVYICVPECTHTQIIRRRDEAFGAREKGGEWGRCLCVRGCEVIMCVCFERWMNGVKIALICRGTVLPSGLMSVPG